MASPFSRTLRSLNADSYLVSMVSLTIALVLLLLWLAWFVFAQITLYETSNTFKIVNDETVLVYFPHSAQTQIQPGQAALLRLDVPIGAEAATIPAMVMDVEIPLTAQQIVAELYVMSQFSPIPLRDGLTGKIDIEVEHISPATLVMRATRQLMDAPEVTVSPQDSNLLSPYR